MNPFCPRCRAPKPRLELKERKDKYGERAGRAKYYQCPQVKSHQWKAGAKVIK